MTERSGVICAGNWIVDLVHDIDHWPAESNLTRISAQTRGIGGGAANVISSVFEGREIRMIVLAAVFGGLAPFCSCEVIPFVAALLAVGTPLSAIMAFWLASPLIDPPSLVITAGAMGWRFAIGKPIRKRTADNQASQNQNGFLHLALS